MSAEQPGAAPSQPARPTVVVGFDHHPSSASALVVALSMASVMAARLHVVHVVDLADAYPDPDAADWEARTEANVRAEQRAAEAVLEGFEGEWVYQTCRGQAAVVLSRIAAQENAVMIVIGESRAGHGARFAHLFDRSVLQHLLHSHPTAPVLVVPERAGPPR